jgi:hypothetical protein
MMQFWVGVFVALLWMLVVGIVLYAAYLAQKENKS